MSTAKMSCVLPPSEMEITNRILLVNDDGRRYKVDILYGPTKVCGVLKHRTTRVEHIKEKLKTLGFEVKLRRTLDYEMVIFAFEGETVFTCLATNLSVLGCSTNDPTAYRLISLMLAERNHANRKYYFVDRDTRDYEFPHPEADNILRRVCDIIERH